MDEQCERCAELLSDARCDALAYACLIGLMAQDSSYHEESVTQRVAEVVDNGAGSHRHKRRLCTYPVLDIARINLISPTSNP